MHTEKTGIWYHDSSIITFTYWFIKVTLGSIVKFLWVERIYGISNIPKDGPLIIAFNHQSFLDFLCFTAISPRKIHFLSAEKFFLHPVWSLIMKFTGQIKVERDSRDKTETHRIVYQHLNSNKVIGIFPEGTRSPHKFDMLPAFTGVAEFALRGKVKVLPVGIRGTYDVMAKNDKFPNFKKIVNIYVGEVLDFTEYNNSKMDKKTFKVVTNKIMTEISKLSEKNYNYSD